MNNKQYVHQTVSILQSALAIILLIGFAACADDETSITDVAPPAPGNGGAIMVSNVSHDSMQLSWSPATDDVTGQDGITYAVYSSLEDNIQTVEDCILNGTLIEIYDYITDVNALDLTSNTSYYFNVLVSDIAGNTACYTPKQWNTAPEPPSAAVIVQGDGTLSLSWNAVDGASYYSVWYGVVNNGSMSYEYSPEVHGTAQPITALTNGMTYYVWIRSHNQYGKSGFGAAASGTPAAD